MVQSRVIPQRHQVTLVASMSSLINLVFNTRSITLIVWPHWKGCRKLGQTHFKLRCDSLSDVTTVATGHDSHVDRSRTQPAGMRGTWKMRNHCGFEEGNIPTDLPRKSRIEVSRISLKHTQQKYVALCCSYM